jgi:hypothetical protein
MEAARPRLEGDATLSDVDLDRRRRRSPDPEMDPASRGDLCTDG